MAGMNGTVNRYRVMALVAGVMSLLLWFVYMPLEGFKNNSDEGNSLLWIAIAHGYIYMIYVLTDNFKINWFFNTQLNLYKNILFLEVLIVFKKIRKVNVNIEIVS